MRLFSASSFVQFLIKICFIPVQLNEDKIVFRIFSWRTLVHVLVYYGWTFYGSIIITPASVITDLFAKLSTVEIVNEILWFICYLVGKTTPLFLANGLKNSVNIRIFCAPNIEGPPNIVGTLYLQD